MYSPRVTFKKNHQKREKNTYKYICRSKKLYEELKIFRNLKSFCRISGTHRSYMKVRIKITSDKIQYRAAFRQNFQKYYFGNITIILKMLCFVTIFS